MNSNENTREVGNRAEDRAIKYLQDNNYEILERNFYILGGEIDIIAKKDNRILFFEVKFIQSEKFNSLSQKIPLSKKRKLMKSAKMYLKRENINMFEVGLQFDLLFIFRDEIKHIDNFIIENEVM